MSAADVLHPPAGLLGELVGEFRDDLDEIRQLLRVALAEVVVRDEEREPAGLNGAIILIHPGTEPERTDKLWSRLEEIISYYTDK